MSDKIAIVENSTSFDENYREWKNWDEDQFGVLKPSTAKYYAAEFKRAGFTDLRGLDVLEIGFGNGALLEFCKRNGSSVIGTEMNTDLVTAATRAGYDARPASALAELSEASFDAVVAIDVLEHIPTDQASAFLSELLRVLRPGGVVIAHFPNADSPFGLCFQHGDVTHINAIGAEKARYYARAVGADVVLIGGEAQPIPAGSLAHTVHRTLALPFRFTLNWLVRLIFLPGARVDFSAPNLTMILKKR